MKIARRTMTIALAVFVLIGCVGCSFLETSPSEKLETKIYGYLSEKYPGLEFEIKSYTQDHYTSGKYVVNVFCKTTEIDFLVYHSSFLTTDSYTVTCANIAMEEILLGILGKEITDTYVDSAQWLDIYADGSTGYRFREVDLSQMPFKPSDIRNIDHIYVHAKDIDDLAHAIKSVSEKLLAGGVLYENITFEWKLNDYTVLFTTNSNTLKQISDEEFDSVLKRIEEARQSDELVSIAPLSRTKTVRYFYDGITSDKDNDESKDDKNEKDENQHNEDNKNQQP